MSEKINFGNNIEGQNERNNNLEAPSKRGDRVECDINGKKVEGVIFNDDISGGQLVAILLDENIGSDYLNGFGTSLGAQHLDNPEKIKKIGELSPSELEDVLVKVNEFSKS